MASITRYDPRFDPMSDLVEDIFKGFLVRPLAYEGARGEALPRVKVDVAEKNGAYKVTADLPGVRKEDIQVSIDGAQVTAYLESDAGVSELADELLFAAQNDITAVPTYVFDGKWSVPGAQDVAVFERVLLKLSEKS